ncbi:MBL fold metallo-hydrolase [Cryptosporangium aurantiacum]|uniref:L-ascorbate metabolism protein UlaG, beta-lactamase superfamily n=1 Tax=Cryptosporangium aurantiacum TaxID=134849 RepID=A0A1M7RNY7_9ACTN|nr:MBL fold metallo-hydrolase [Cryptosporangium aurantiacum]SHN48045.1 L-ascorbate metabolism protein UlaG, beta-lactamase superfamily [Cryptosporangium aurantiacum]
MTSVNRAVGSLMFIGNATVLLRLGGCTVLTDPNFLRRGERAYLGYGLSSRRLVDPAIAMEALPPLDAVVLSHLHGDHFDRRARHGLERSTPIVTTAHAARRLERWGFRAAEGLRPWAAWELRHGTEVLRVTSVPGQHGPDLVHRLLPPVMGSVVDLERDGVRVFRLYITGDTLCRPWLGEIAERYPGIDAALVHLGGTRILGVLLTMDEQQGADLVELIDPSFVFPIHNDDYTVQKTPLQAFLDETARRRIAGVRPIERGHPVPLATAVSDAS